MATDEGVAQEGKRAATKATQELAISRNAPIP